MFWLGMLWSVGLWRCFEPGDSYNTVCYHMVLLEGEERHCLKTVRKRRDSFGYRLVKPVVVKIKIPFNKSLQAVIKYALILRTTSGINPRSVNVSAQR